MRKATYRLPLQVKGALVWRGPTLFQAACPAAQMSVTSDGVRFSAAMVIFPDGRSLRMDVSSTGLSLSAIQKPPRSPVETPSGLQPSRPTRSAGKALSGALQLTLRLPRQRGPSKSPRLPVKAT